MSYSGFVQYWCKNGHLSHRDAYDDYFDDNDFTCPICAASLGFRNGVDTTNGSYEYDADGKTIRIDGYIEPEVVIPALTCTCKECGNTHTIGEPIYKVPTK